jgi:hypothetical protein
MTNIGGGAGMTRGGGGGTFIPTLIFTPAVTPIGWLRPIRNIIPEIVMMNSSFFIEKPPYLY